ncbi:hypothetical protein AMATHDRAFT_55458 [Amanita thiersii Skay4041]|uniref:Autophagy-related protein 17 n=1 Tax=Amanita thiersii Skay4041 TaxID=703135 RepID=A0A2A9NRB9_9AGAR|nr:hypothetical protein AMATHDRAFT_55458 [Amanita thiersii Skay4041]
MVSSQNSHQQPHLVSLVLQSKKALQHGEQLCSKAHTQSNASAQTSISIMGLDAKVKWISTAALEQLKMAANVAKCIQEKRAYLLRQIQSWDGLRVKHTDALDKILDALGAQVVPSEFHESTADSSIFGSQFSDDEMDEAGKAGRKRCGNSTPVINGHGSLNGINGSSLSKKQRSQDRSRWKTLRDFVDDQAIEDALETIDSERTAIDELLGQTEGYSETLSGTIESIRNSIPADLFPTTVAVFPHISPTTTNAEQPSTISVIQACLAAQDTMKASMAVRLEDLTRHYDQMANALRETETGPESDIFSEDDIREINRDTEELPAIIGELEESLNVIDLNRDKLQSILTSLKKNLEDLGGVLDDLDELGDIMTEMLQTQEAIETKFEEGLNGLHQHLVTLEQLHERYVSYQIAYNKLMLEMARRRQYCEALDHIVKGMAKQLEDMTVEESKVRSLFNSEYGAHLPEDICLHIGNMPTRWQVLPWDGDIVESLPEIPNDLISEARDKVGFTDVIGAESL